MIFSGTNCLLKDHPSISESRLEVYNRQFEELWSAESEDLAAQRLEDLLYHVSLHKTPHSATEQPPLHSVAGMRYESMVGPTELSAVQEANRLLQSRLATTQEQLSEALKRQHGEIGRAHV